MGESSDLQQTTNFYMIFPMFLEYSIHAFANENHVAYSTI